MVSTLSQPTPATEILPPSKPKLLFLKCTYPSDLPPFLLLHTHEHVKCLSQFFDVTVIHPPCDYRQVCEAHQPDLALFETGLNISTCRKGPIANVDTFRHIPRLGFINADGWCETRSGILCEMDEWGINTYFSISLTAGEHMPEIRDNLFIWPNSIDADVYNDYGEPKLIPVLLTGSTGPQYPWRKAVFSSIARQYPTLSCPHHGYLSRSEPGKVLYGERYARTINASRVVPACGTVAKELVRKHLEIPACRACLITESSPGLRAAGFVDMRNCVFADGKDVLDKIGYLFAHVSELEAISDSGYELVHSRHTLKQRDHVLEWFRLYQTLRPGERIVQTSPFEPLAVVDSQSDVRNHHLISGGLHLSLLHEGDLELTAGAHAAAESRYRACLQYMRRLPEAHLRLGISRLCQGDAADARHWIVKPIQYTLAEYGTATPDPVEWAYFVFSLLCEGDASAAVKTGNQFSWMRHPELDRVRWVVRAVSTGAVTPLPNDDGAHHRPSIHQLPTRTNREGMGQLCLMLKACGQDLAAERVAGILSQLAFPLLAETPGPVACGSGRPAHDASVGKSCPVRFRDYRATAYFKRRAWYSKIRGRLRRYIALLRWAVTAG